MDFENEALESLCLVGHSLVRSDAHFEVHDVHGLVASRLSHSLVPFGIAQNVVLVWFDR